MFTEARSCCLYTLYERRDYRYETHQASLGDVGTRAAAGLGQGSEHEGCGGAHCLTTLRQGRGQLDAGLQGAADD